MTSSGLATQVVPTQGSKVRTHARRSASRVRRPPRQAQRGPSGRTTHRSVPGEGHQRAPGTEDQDKRACVRGGTGEGGRGGEVGDYINPVNTYCRNDIIFHLQANEKMCPSQGIMTIK